MPSRMWRKHSAEQLLTGYCRAYALSSVTQEKSWTNAKRNTIEQPCKATKMTSNCNGQGKLFRRESAEIDKNQLDIRIRCPDRLDQYEVRV